MQAVWHGFKRAIGLGEYLLAWVGGGGKAWVQGLLPGGGGYCLGGGAGVGQLLRIAWLVGYWPGGSKYGQRQT